MKKTGKLNRKNFTYMLNISENSFIFAVSNIKPSNNENSNTQNT